MFVKYLFLNMSSLYFLLKWKEWDQKTQWWCDDSSILNCFWNEIKNCFKNSTFPPVKVESQQQQQQQQQQ